MDSLNELQREDEQRRSAEQRARRWLREIIPLQAEVYEKFGFIEVPSKLYKGRTYRIHGGEGDFRTSLYQNGKKLARLCLMMLDPEIPPTDRVIAEYYLLQGDEQQYLATANIQNLIPESRASRLGSVYGLSRGYSLGGEDNIARVDRARTGRNVLLMVLGGILLLGLARVTHLQEIGISWSWASPIGRAGVLAALVFIGVVMGLIYALKRYRPPS